MSEQKEALLNKISPVDVLFAILAGLYIFIFCWGISPYWFHPGWTTDDALQQIFPFHEVFHPGIFKGDIIYEAMRGYLAPLHYALGYAITWLCGDPIMMGHWMMLLQVLLAAGFLFATVKKLAGYAPAFFAVAWLFHTRHIMQRITAGLPRGWAAPIIAASLYFMLTKNHRGMLITLLAGCLLHPPATLLVAVAYGLYLTGGVLYSKTRKEFLKPFIVLALLSPVYAIVTYKVIERPASMGQMVSYEEAAQMPEFQYPKGRFPFVPHRPVSEHMRNFAFQAFIGRFHNPGKFWRMMMIPIVITLLLALVAVGIKRKRNPIPMQLWAFLAGTMLVYFASRQFAFKLYVPDRHLQFPMGFFWITTLSIGVWNVFKSGTKRDHWIGALGLLLLSFLIWSGSKHGLQGAANFNYAFDKKGRIFSWVRASTPEQALIAGHPTFIDGVQLFGMRRGYVTTETSHPFYPIYYAEMNRRLIISLKAHYAKSFEELLALLEPEGVNYFVFEKARFYPEALRTAVYFPPLNELVTELTSGDPEKYAYRQLPKEVDLATYPWMPFRDDQSAAVDLKALREYLSRRK